jgi:hypothetical protein
MLNSELALPLRAMKLMWLPRVKVMFCCFQFLVALLTHSCAVMAALC